MASRDVRPEQPVFASTVYVEREEIDFTNIT